MASLGVVPDHSCDEQIEKGNEELKTIEQGVIPSSKENKVIDVDEKINAEESVSVKAPPESEQEVANIQIVPSAIADAEKVEKFDEAPDSDAPITDDSQVGVSPDSKLDISSVPESVVEAVENKSEESSKVPEVTESSIDRETGVNGSLKEEVSLPEPKTIEKPDSVVEAVQKPQEAEEMEEKSETLKPKASTDTDCGKDQETNADESSKEEVSVVEPTKVEKSESVIEMGIKPQEQAEEVEKKSEMLEPKESMDGNVTKDEATTIDMVKKYAESLKEGEVTKYLDLVASESYTVACAGQEAESGMEEDGIRSVTPDVVENVSVDDTKKEVEVDEKAVVKMGDSEAEKEEKVANVEKSNDKDVKIEELTQPEGTEIIEGKEAKDMNIDENAENNVRTEELMLPEPMKTKDVGGSYAGTEVAEKPSEEQSTSRDVETVIEEKKEQEARVDTLDSNGNVDVVDSTSVVNELTRESKENVIEGKVEEAIQSCVDNNVDKRENVVEETAKSGAPNVELSKIEDKSETDQVPPKQEVPAKAPQKQSSSIISKVKQSIVKVKRAIIGKSPSSKTLSSEAKDDIQVK